VRDATIMGDTMVTGKAMKPADILLAEDNSGDVLLIRQALLEHHVAHDLHVMPDGAAAIEFVLRMGTPGVPCPDLVLLDLNLPKVDGAEVLSAIRMRSECSNTPVIVITSSDAPRDKQRLEKLGVTRYFRKPSNLADYMQLGAAVLDALAGG
jgi:CheY-like chemotaxis protein